MAADNNAGRLNVRNTPGIDFEVVDVLERGTTAFTAGVCRTVDEINWWAIVGADGDPAWVSGQFLSAEPVLDPGIGNPIASGEYIGLSAATLDAVVANIATSLGFADNVAVSSGEITGEDASGFRQTFTLTGLTDEKTNGYSVDLQLMNTLSEDGAQIVGVTVLSDQVSPLCTRGVAANGRCI